MQNKRARKAAREVNQFLQPELKPDKAEALYIKKNGRTIPKNQRSLSAIANQINLELRRGERGLPTCVSPLHYKVIEKLKGYAFRDNREKVSVKCPHCKEYHDIELQSFKAEKNSIDALITLADRMFPKLGHLTQEINLVGQINQVTDGLVGIIIKHVPNDRRMDALGEISTFIERLRVNEHKITEGSADTDRLITVS